MNNSNLFYDISLQTIFARGIRSQKRERCERAAREIREEFMRGGPEVKGVVLTMALEISWPLESVPVKKKLEDNAPEISTVEMRRLGEPLRIIASSYGMLFVSKILLVVYKT